MTSNPKSARGNKNLPRVFLTPTEGVKARGHADAVSGRTQPLVSVPDVPLASDMVAQFREYDRTAGRLVSIYGAYLRAGTWFTGYHEPHEWPAPLVGYTNVKPPLVRMCFYNSMMAGVVGPARELGLSYFEGVVYLPAFPFPIEHAWLGTESGGTAVDLTFPAADRSELSADPTFRTGAVYCGLAIPWGFLTRLTVADEHVRPRLADWLATAVAHCEGSG